MPLVRRVLPAVRVTGLRDYVDRGGGRGLATASRLSAGELIDLIEAAGLRGRGGAGFPTGQKWRTVAGMASSVLPTTVVVNGAEGEPGTFKDRAILRAVPHLVLEGALIAARAVGATDVVVAVKASFDIEAQRLRSALDEIAGAGWLGEVDVSVFEGPDEYLYGEETALLESIAGRPPFPRIAPPWRRGVIEVVASDADVDSGSGQSAPVEMAGATDAPPALVNNVETLANVPAIVEREPDWFRSVGTVESPGTAVCTISGSTVRAGVGEIAMGTRLREAIEAVGGGLPEGRSVQAVLVGVSGAVLRGDQLDVPLSYEGMSEIGANLGSAGFIVLDDTVDLATAAAGAARFLAIESCGQCTPCKQDGLAIAAALADLCAGRGSRTDADDVPRRLTTVADGARCGLAGQQQVVIGSLLRLDPEILRVRTADDRSDPSAPMLLAELLDIDGGVAVVDGRFASKQPDWTFDDDDSGQSPVERLTDRRAAEQVQG
jgi:NADH:ubiquinone oxidoreductase subunit F (NADH-binding)